MGGPPSCSLLCSGLPSASEAGAIEVEGSAGVEGNVSYFVCQLGWRKGMPAMAGVQRMEFTKHLPDVEASLLLVSAIARWGDG
jgi:hypothetical protein